MAKATLEIRSLARIHTKTALRVLAGVMEQETAPPQARVAAAQALLDRGWGKAAQAIELTGEITSKVVRAPSVSASTSDWAAEHVPDHITEH